MSHEEGTPEPGGNDGRPDSSASPEDDAAVLPDVTTLGVLLREAVGLGKVSPPPYLSA